MSNDRTPASDVAFTPTVKAMQTHYGAIDDDITLIKQLMPQNYKARPERVILFTVLAWDANCKQHIPQRFEAAEVNVALAQRDKRIRELEIEVERLRAPPPG